MTYKSKVIFSLSLFMLILSFSKAQVVVKEDSGNNEIKVFTHEEDKNKLIVSSVIKLSPVHFARGKFAIFNQLKLNQIFSLEVGAGVSFVDYFYIYAVEGSEGQSKEYSFGPYLESSIIIHPSKQPILGYYGALNLRYSNTPYKFSGFNPLIDGQKGFINDLGVSMIFGYQDTDWSDSFIYDLYGGFGFVNSTKTSIGYDESLTEIIEEGTSLRPVLRLVIKLGMKLY